MYCPTGAAIQTTSAEAGVSKALYNIEGVTIRAWNSLNVVVRPDFDAVRRPTHLYVKIGAAIEFLAQRTVYAEGLVDSTTPILWGRVYRVYDGAGVATSVQHDFKGNLLQHNRVLALAYTTTVDWIAIANITNIATIAATAASQLGTETFTTSSTFDALNRVVTLTTPDTSVCIPIYNEANLLEKVDVLILGLSPATHFVQNIDYNARGQRTAIDYAGTSTATFSTAYTYDAMTFRLSEQVTRRASDSKVLQDFSPVYDPVGKPVTGTCAGIPCAWNGSANDVLNYTCKWSVLAPT